MIRIKCLCLLLFLIISVVPLSAEDTEQSWLNKKILKLENSSDIKTPSSNLITNSIVSSINLSDFAEEILTLPYYYWSWSKIEDLTLKVDSIYFEPKAQLRELIVSVLTSEMPANIEILKEANLYIARLNKLLELGQYKEAQTFINIYDPNLTLSYQQQFELNLLKGNDTLACSQSRIEGTKNNTLKQKIYCLNHEGKQSEARIVFETAKILNKIEDYDTYIIELLLNSKEFAQSYIIDIKNNLSILDYIILQKNDIKIEDKFIPTSFLFYNLSQTYDIEKKLIISEKLAKFGIISNLQLFKFYKESDIVNDKALIKRKKCVNELELSILKQSSDDIRQNLVKCLSLFQKIGLSSDFSKYYRTTVLAEVNSGWETPTSVKMLLLSKDYSSLKTELTENSNFNSAQSIALNNFTKLNGLTAFEKSITNVFKNPKYKAQNASLIDQGKIGEVIISSIILLESEDLNEMQDGLIALIQVGLTDVAKDIAIKFLLES